MPLYHSIITPYTRVTVTGGFLARGSTGVLFVLLLLAISKSASAVTPADHNPTHLLIQFKAETRALIAGLHWGEALLRLRDELPLPSGAVLEESAMGRILREHAQSTELILDRFLYLKVNDLFSTEAAMARLAGHPLVEFVEKDFYGYPAGLVPNDPASKRQWYHTNAQPIYTPKAWEFTTGSPAITVAVLDTGIDTNQVDFKGRLVPGYNFVEGNTNIHNERWHGLAVASVLAATGNNGTGIAGVDWRCRIMPVRVIRSSFSQGGTFATAATGADGSDISHWAQGIDFAVTNGAKVINLSGWADLGTNTDNVLTRAISNAWAKGVIFVAAMYYPGYPALSPYAIAVGASRMDGKRSEWSFSGNNLDLLAPGEFMSTLVPSSTYSGTSYAAPLVAGVCSLLAGLHPNITPAQARALICAGADEPLELNDDPPDTPGWDPHHGWGTLNAYASILLSLTRIDQSRSLPTGHVELSWQSPANAFRKQPYQIEVTPALGQPWQLLPSPDLRYQPDRTFLTLQPGQTAFYRVKIRQDWPDGLEAPNPSP